MRKFFLTLGLGFCSAAMTHAQITLDSTNFKANQNSVEKVKAFAGTSFSTPQSGTNVSYDFSAMKDTNIMFTDTFKASTYSAFPSTSRMKKITNYIGNMELTTWAHFGTAANGYGPIGYHLDHHAFGIGSMTGNNNDSLIFLEQDSKTGTYPYVKFPATAGSTWNSSVSEKTHFELTVNSFGMNKTPGYREQHIMRIDSVIGWGTMRVPTSDSASKPYDVLLVKSFTNFIDSFYLGGSPAPDQLLNTFGLEQGAVYKQRAYFFYRPGHVNPLVEIFADDDWTPISAYYDTENTSSVGIFEPNTQAVAVNVYPNPVSNGNLQMEFTKTNAAKWSINISDITGKVIANQMLNNAAGNVKATVNVDGAANGMYFYNIINNDGVVVANGKVLISK